MALVLRVRTEPRRPEDLRARTTRKDFVSVASAALELLGGLTTVCLILISLLEVLFTFVGLVFVGFLVFSLRRLVLPFEDSVPLVIFSDCRLFINTIGLNIIS